MNKLIASIAVKLSDKKTPVYVHIYDRVIINSGNQSVILTDSSIKLRQAKSLCKIIKSLLSYLRHDENAIILEQKGEDVNRFTVKYSNYVFIIEASLTTDIMTMLLTEIVVSFSDREHKTRIICSNDGWVINIGDSKISINQDSPRLFQ